jgi:hypothetical protein
VGGVPVRADVRAFDLRIPELADSILVRFPKHKTLARKPHRHANRINVVVDKLVLLHDCSLNIFSGRR